MDSLIDIICNNNYKIVKKNFTLLEELISSAPANPIPMGTYFLLNWYEYKILYFREVYNFVVLAIEFTIWIVLKVFTQMWVFGTHSKLPMC